MSNQVVQFQPAQAVVPNFTMSDMERVALAIAKGGLFGSSDPNAVLTLCMLAQAEGQHPAVVFRDYHIISGKPAKKAEAMHRDFLAAGGKIEWHQCDDDCADATFSHPQGGSMRISWDNARVTQAQLTGNAMHKKYPRQMKRSRVISEGVRSVYPMATSGLYETGEVQDIVAETRPTPPTPEAKRARDLQVDDATDKAADWTRDHIEVIVDAATAEDLATVEQAGAKAMIKLQRDRPDLHESVLAAYEKRVEELAPEPEVRADTETGEADNADDQADETPLWQKAVDAAMNGAREAKTLADLKKVDAAWVNARAGVTDDAIVSRVDDMIAAARREMQVP